MRQIALLLAAAFACVQTAAATLAADVSRLEWGGFVVESDSSNGLQDWTATSSDDGRSVSLTFAALEAKADGQVLEGKANLSGYFDISQPATEVFGKFHVEVAGYVVKSQTAIARLTLKIGSEEKVIEWPGNAAMSEKFTRSFDVILPGGGKLPDPFPVSAEAFAQKNAATDSAFVSLNSLSITADNPLVAER